MWVRVNVLEWIQRWLLFHDHSRSLAMNGLSKIDTMIEKYSGGGMSATRPLTEADVAIIAAPPLSAVVPIHVMAWVYNGTNFELAMCVKASVRGYIGVWVVVEIDG
jgi:uncharacterized ParB-like nuclease family protein